MPTVAIVLVFKSLTDLITVYFISKKSEPFFSNTGQTKLKLYFLQDPDKLVTLFRRLMDGSDYVYFCLPYCIEENVLNYYYYYYYY